MKPFKKGQKAWSSQDGEIEISDIREGTNPVKVKDIGSYTKDGLQYYKDKHPTLFHSLKDCQDYFNSLKERRTHKVWVSLYRGGGACIYSNKYDAETINAKEVVECREITWEA